MFAFLLILLVVLVIIIAYNMSIFAVVGGKVRDRATALIMILRTPVGVKEIRNKYIKTDSQPPHITLGYLEKGFNEDEILKHLRSIRPAPIEFEKWKHTDTFIGLIPKNIDEIKRIVGPIAKYITNGPRGGYHMSLAYKPGEHRLDEYAHKKAHESVHVPMKCPVVEIRLAKLMGDTWIKYKSAYYD